jgi:hypothetical protein
MQVVLSWIAIGGEEGVRARRALLLAREAGVVAEAVTGLVVGREGGREGGKEKRRVRRTVSPLRM